MMVPKGNVSTTPPYTPMTDIVPPFPQGDGTVRFQHQRLLRAIDGVLHPVPMGFETNGVDARIRPAASRHLDQGLADAVHRFVVHGFGATLLARHLEAIVEPVDANHAPGAEQKGALDRKQADRATAPDGDRVAGLDVAHLRAHVTRR